MSSEPTVVDAAPTPVRVAATGVTAWTKVLYGLGEIAITTKMVLFGLFVLFFYNTVMGLPAVWVGAASALGLVLDAVIDPYIGYRSDIHEGRYGRRHPFMLWGTLTMGLCFWMIWAPPRSWSPVGVFFWLLAAMLLFRLTSALFRIPYLSLGAELSDDYHERTSIVGVRSFFGLVGSLAAASLSFLLFFPNTTPGVDPKLGYDGYPRMGLAFGLLITASAAVALVGTLQHRSHGAPGQARPDFATFLAGFRSALANHSFRKVWLSFSLFFVAVVLNGVISIHFLTWYVEIEDSAVVGKLQGLFYATALVGVLFWIVVSRRTEKLVVYVFATSVACALVGSAPFLFGEGRPLGTGTAAPLFLLFGLAGFFASALWVVPASMVADVADEDELETGLRREGLFFGILNFGEKIAAGIAVLIGGGLIDYFAGLEPGQSAQSPETVARIGWIFGGAPALLLLAALVIVVGYDLDRSKVSAIQNRVRESRRRPPAPTIR